MTTEQITASLHAGLQRAVSAARGEWGILGALRQDHTAIRAMLHGVEKHLDEPDVARAIFLDVRERITAHCAAEERVLYDRVEELHPSRTLEAEREHEAIVRLVHELGERPVADPSWRDGLESLHRAIALHFADEETQLFPLARARLTRGERNSMAARYARLRDRKQHAAVARPD